MNPGNSGGPLLNSIGAVIGMNTFIVTKSEASAGVGFAIPISTIKGVANILIQKGTIARPNFGIVFDMSVQAGLGSILPKQGALISDVLDEAKRKKLEATTMLLDGSIHLGDVITKVNGVEVDSDLDVYSIVENLKPGDEVTLNILRLKMEKGKKSFIPKTVKITV